MILVNKINRTLFSLILLGSIFFIIKYSIVKISSKDNIWFEAENSSNKLTGFSIINANELSGGKGIVSLAGSHIIENFLEYDFFINSTTNYSTWGRMYGENACGNSFYISFDNSNKFLIGNDDLMKQWHWLKGPEISFNPGKHKMYIWNQEQGTGIDKILLTSNYSFFPVGKGRSNDFQLNFMNKHTDIIDYNDSDKWIITTYNIEKSICPKYFDKENNYFILKNRIQSSYYFSGEFYYDTKINFNLLFIYGYINSSNYSFIEIDDKSIKKYRKNNGIETLIAKSYCNIKEILKDKINRISLLNKGDRRFLLLNGFKIEEIVDNDFQNGNIGLGTRTNNIYLTSLSLTSNIMPVFNTNFFDGIGSCKIIHGNWKLFRDPLYNILGEKFENTPGIVISGFEYWSDYSYRCIIHFNLLNCNGAAGIIFNFQDANNYHLFEYENKGTQGKIKLIKVRDSKVSILGEINKNIDSKQFYKFEVKELEDSIKTYIDEKLVFDIKDNGDLMGKIGLYSNYNENNVFFDDLNLQPTVFKGDSIKVFEYLFNNRLSISNDLSDWSDSHLFLSPLRNSTFKTKELFESIEIFNKKIFKDELNLEVNTYSIPIDVDFGIHLKSVENKNDINILLKRNCLILKINGKKQEFQFDQSNRKWLEISFKDLKKSLMIKIGGTLVIDKLMIDNLEEYKLGIEFKGVGNWDISLPQMILKTNNYFVNKF